MAVKRGYLLAAMIVHFCFSCNDHDDVLGERCLLAPDPGPCFAAIPKYYYNKEERKCKEFIWGGCGGLVPFDTLEACKECESKG